MKRKQEMTIAIWCVLAAILFPYFFTILAKSSKHFDNKDPRTYLQNLSGWRKRAHYVQLNSFEVHPAFAIAIIIAQLINTHQTTINLLAITFIVTRILYAICYLADRATLRSVCWFVGMGCIVALFFIP